MIKYKYYGYLNINHGQELYSIDCGIGSTFMNDEWELTLDDKYICGTMHPNNYKDCIKASTEENSCCFYEEEDMKGCYWLGIKHKGKVTKIMAFGAFVEFLPGKEGLVHISKLAKTRVKKVEDVKSFYQQEMMTLKEYLKKNILVLNKKNL